jgi:Carboxypeptidase regulatory-like domain/TonB-dependent Receptor Plug Domain
MTRLHVVLIAAFLPAFPLAAQQAAFVGTVGDSVTGAPLGGVTISVPDLELQTTSEADGSFRLPGAKSGTFTVFVRRAGYEPWAVRLRLTVSDQRDLPLGAIFLAPAHQAAFFGTVEDSLNGEPLEGADIFIPELNVQTKSNPDGTFRIEGIPSGETTVLIRAVGFELWARTLSLDVKEPLQVDFGTVGMTRSDAYLLSNIAVEGEEFRGSSIMADFMHRRRTEKGTFLTYEDIEKTNPERTSDILRSVPGFTVERDGRVISGRGVSGIQNLSPCTVQYFIDGVHVAAASIDVIMPHAIAGMEIYTGSSTVPPVFRRGPLDPKCGVVAVWTKDASYRARN